MKINISTIFFLALFSISALGQNNKEVIGDFKRHSDILEKEHQVVDQMLLTQRNRNISKGSLLRSAQSYKQKLDSIVICNFNSDYDTKQEYTYNNNGNEAECINSALNEGSTVWDILNKEEYAYDSYGNKTKIYKYSWSSQDYWSIDDKYYYANSYDANGKILKKTYYYWGELKNETEYVYDDNGYLKQILGWKIDGVVSYVSSEYNYIYDDSGNLIQSIRDLNDYSFDSKSIFLYDEFQNLVKEIIYSKNSSYEWERNEMNIYTYDSNGYIIKAIKYWYYEYGDEWVQSDKEVYTYDENNNMIMSIMYESNILDEWILHKKIEYIYNNSYTFFEICLPSNFSIEVKYPTNHMMLSYTEYLLIHASNTWEKYITNNYYYSDQNTNSISNTEAQKIQINTTIVHDNVSFNLPDSYTQTNFGLFDVQGRKVFNKTIENGENINLSNLNKGMYFYQLTTGNQKQSGKIIKE